MDKTIIARDSDEMEEIGIGIAEGLVDGSLVSLVGPLGSGKTTLTKGIAKGLLITEVVASPSYLLARTYQGRLTLHHIDAYYVAYIVRSVKGNGVCENRVPRTTHNCTPESAPDA